MTSQEIEKILELLFRKRPGPYDPPTQEDWKHLAQKFGTEFNDDFLRFMELIGRFRFRGEILNVARHGNVGRNDSIETSYDFEMEHGRWNEDMIPFYSIGNGDYFCLSASGAKTSPVFYAYHEDGRVERYSDTFENWITQLKTFFSHERGN